MVEHGDRRRRVTIVDGNTEFVGLLAEALDGHFDVEGCPDAELGAIAATHPDVVLLDPWTADEGRDGLSFIARMRDNGALRRLPIIVCAPPTEDDRLLERLRSLRDVFFLPKPFALEQLEQLLAQVATPD